MVTMKKDHSKKLARSGANGNTDSPKKSTMARFVGGSAKSSSKLLLALPTLFAVMAMIGRSLYHSSFDGAVSEMHVHRLAVAKAVTTPKSDKTTPKQQQVRVKETTSKKPKLRSNTKDKLFKPSRRDLHLDISSARVDHPYLTHDLRETVGFRSDRRKLAAQSGKACILPSALCDHSYATVSLGGGNSQLYKVNIVSGDENPIGPIGFEVVGMAFDRSTKAIFGNTADGKLIKVDPCTGQGTLVGAMGVITDSLAIDSKGHIFAWAQSRLVKINKQTGAASPVGNANVATRNLAFDDCDLLHAVNFNKHHYIINTTSGEAILKGMISGLAAPYLHGDVLPGSKLLYSPFNNTPSMQVIDLQGDKEDIVITTAQDYSTSAFVCDKLPEDDYTFFTDRNATNENNNFPEGFKSLRVYAEDGEGVKKFPPKPGHVAKPPKGGELWAELLKDCVKRARIDTGDATVRYETPASLDYTIDFVYFTEIAVGMFGPGPEVRIHLKVFQHGEDGSSRQIVNSSPIVRKKGVVFFVPLQPGNHTIQLTDGSGTPIEDSPDCQHATVEIKTFPCNRTDEPPAEPSSSPTQAPTLDLGPNENCPLNNETMTPECEKGGSNTWGDPHLITFDNLKFDCQTLGDHVISRSRKTDFEIHSRYGKPYFRKEFLAWMIGVAIQEGHPRAPVVEISLDTPFDSADGLINSTCDKTILVDGVKVTGDITRPGATNSDYVWLKEDRNKKNEHIITVSYWSGLIVEVKDRARKKFGCSLTTSIKVPLYMTDQWDLFGLMGSPDGKKSNDWVTPNGFGLPIPGSGKRKVNAMAAAHYCRQWCLTNQEDSLFDYSATRHRFRDWENCTVGMEYSSKGDTDEAADHWLKFIEEVNDNTPEVITDCAGTASSLAAKGNTRFDQQDCIVELVGGADMVDVIDDQAAIAEGQLQTTGIAFCGDRRKVECLKKHGAYKLLNKKSEEYSIACCINTESWEPPTGVSVVDPTTGQCMAKANFLEAHDVCAAIPGGRLCTQEEISDLVLDVDQASNQCDLSTEMVWTSSLPAGQLEVFQWKVCGTKNGCSSGMGALVNATDTAEKAKVRCCSKHAISGWVENKQCELWSQSKFDGECSGDVTHEAAVSYCLARGGYLCGKEDLQNDCTKGSGCDYDKEQVWAMDMGIVEIAPPVTADPYAALDAEQKRWLACGDKNVLGCFQDEGAYEIVAAESELHEVRCCKESTSDLSSDGWTNNEGCPNIWAKSKISNDGDGCVHAASYSSAEGYCNAVGGVVCNKEWVNDGCTKGSGCEHETDLVWTSTIVNKTELVPMSMSWVACGAKTKCNGNFGRGAMLRPHNTTHEVRCCSDFYLSGWEKNAGCDVWSESELPICYHAETLEDAREICGMRGGRLCTKAELLSDCAAGSGCNHDADFVWSDTKGWDIVFELEPDTRVEDDKYWLACGDTDKKDCVEIEGTNEHLAPESEKHEFVCCSDDTTLGAPWAVMPLDSCSVMSTAKVDDVCFEAATYSQAKQLCSVVGGRLCTRDEVMGRCVRNVAKSCKLDGSLLWTSEGYDESKQGALQELRWLSCGNKGKCTELHGKGARMEDHLGYNDHEVRCCSDTEMPGWRKKDGCPWTESDINGVCVHANTYEEAYKTCNDVGARLCEKDEMIRQCTQGSGCMHDWDLIWTKTPAFKPPAQVVPEKKAYLACGNADNGNCIKYEGTKEAISSSLDPHEVRCCSDVQFDTTWVNDASNAKCSGVFSKSDVPVCYHDATYDEAQEVCSKYTDDNGNTGRLCTKQEVLDGCADNSGDCGHDVDLIWTSDQVDESTTVLVEKKWTVCGSRDGGCDKGAELVNHKDTSILAAVMCCANHYVSGWKDMDKNSCPSIWSESDLPTSDETLDGVCHYVPYYKAEEICAGYGARLCSKAELVANCGSGSACGHELLMTWSKESGYEVATPAAST